MTAGLIDLQLVQFIATIINVLVLFLFLKKVLFEKVRAFTQKRREEIEIQIIDAERKNIEADEKLRQYSSQISNANDESRIIIEKAKQNAQVRADEILSEAMDESAKIKERAYKDIELEKEKAIRSLKGEVADMVVLTTEKLIGKTVDENTSRSLIDDAINEIGDEKWSS